MTEIVDYINQVSWVFYPLMMVCFLLWFLLIDRYSQIRAVRKQMRTQSCECINLNLYTGQSVCKTLVGLAPLLGLLGTVVGMIECFSALADASAASPQQGVTAGISQALVSTQMGLTVAVPGFLFLKYLDSLSRKTNQWLYNSQNPNKASYGH